MPTIVYLPVSRPADPATLSETYPFGNSALGFHTDLGIGVDPSAADSLPLLAVVDGQVRIHRDTPAATTVTVTLIGMAKVQKDLSVVVGESVVLFVYRNVDVQSVAEAFQPDIAKWLQEQTARGVPMPPLAQLQDDFLAGLFYGFAAAGRPIGKVPAATPTFGIEVVYLPNGLVGDEGFQRAVQLIDPARTSSRRLDPTMLLKRVAAGQHPELVLAPQHAGHPLLAKLGEHVLVELRDEYNEPFSGVVDLTVNGFRTSITVPPADRGMMRLAGGGTVEIALANRVFTDLPSGRSAQAQPSRGLVRPEHWQLQSVYMQDRDDTDSWFVATPSAMPRYTEGNKVTPLLDGLPTFREIVPAIRQATSGSHAIRMANWFMDSKLPMIPGDPSTSLRDLLTAAAANGVQSTALLWQGTANGHVTNGKSSWFINHSLDDSAGNRVGFSIMDDQYPVRGSHHHKFLVVHGDQGTVAFCGGIDYRENRLDDDRHVALEGYHDTHSKVEGPAARDLDRTFIERWNNHPKVTMSGSAYPILADLPIQPPAAGSQFVQVTHTYAPRFGYPFRPTGEVGTLNALRRAIQKAKRFIYFEDQYATPYANDQLDGSGDTLHILTDLLAALDRIEFLMIVLPNHAEAPFNRRYRYQFIRALRHKGGDKVRIFYPARPGFVPVGPEPPDPDPNETDFALVAQGTDIQPMGGSGGKKYRDEIFVHSKIWVVDDVYAKIGTANVNRRSTTFDTEVDLHIIDGALDRGVRSAAQNLRVMCWAEHLRLTGADVGLLDDPVFAISLWDNLAGGRIKRYDEESEGGKGGLFGKRGTFDNVVDPDGR